MKKIKYKIDFTNQKDDKLFFFEGFEGTKRITYAYLKENDNVIYYKPEDDIEEHEFPKKHFREFYLFILNKSTENKFNKRIDTKSKNSKPYFKIKIIGKQMPVIVYTIGIKGLLPALKFLDIKYTINSKKETNYYYMRFDNGDYINFYPKDLYEEYLLNGLVPLRKTLIFEKELMNKPECIEEFIKNRYGKMTFQHINDHKDLLIDKTTAQILKSYGYSTDAQVLFAKTMPRKILNDKVDNIDDMENKRVRMGETIAHLAYKQVTQALVNFKKDKKNESARLFMPQDYIIKNLIDAGMMQWSTPINPLEELNISAKITKTGVGNPKKEQITVSKRDLNPSYFGVVSPTTTNEYGGIGMNQTLVNKMMIKDRFGSIVKKAFDNNTNPFENLSFSESLSPFFEMDDTTRRVMGNQQTSQFVQVNNPDVPLVQTGFESVIPYIVSDRFAIKAKKDGRVTLKNDLIHIKYSDGSEEIFSTKPTKARTKRGLYIPLEYNTLVKNGEKVKANQVLATTNSLKHGKLAIGKNLVVAEMSYRGMNYEDGWVITEDLNEKYESKIYEKVVMVIPENVKLEKFFIQKNKNTKPGEILLEYSVVDSNSNVLDYDDDHDDNEDDLSIGKEIKNNLVRYRSIGGKIVDYVIKLNSKRVDKEIIKKYNEQKAEIESKIKICEKLKSKVNRLDCRDNIDHLESLEIGGHKANKTEPDGAIIEVYIEVENPIRNGSKFTLASSGGKGTVQYVIPKDKKPKAVETGLEIDFIATPLSIISRKNPSILLLLYIGKVIYFLNKKVHEMFNQNKIDEAKALLLKIFNILDNSDEKLYFKQLRAFLENKPEFLKKFVNEHDPLNNPAFPLIVPPFSNKIKIEQIQKAAEILKIPLQEKVYVPEEDGTTEYNVTVGIMPVYLLEHFPKAMSGARGTINAKRQSMTGQGRSGTKEGNGAIKLGLYDMFSVISRSPDKLIKELWAVKSDDEVARRQLRNKILRGEPLKIDDIEVKKEDLKTKKLIEAYFIGALLEPEF